MRSRFVLHLYENPPLLSRKEGVVSLMSVSLVGQQDESSPVNAEPCHALFSSSHGVRFVPGRSGATLIDVFKRFIAVLFFQLERLKTLRTESSVYADVTLDEYLGKRKAGYL